jgi:DNA polymerase-2
VRDYVARTCCAASFDEQLVYRKRLRRPLEEYERNVPPHVRAARIADEFHLRQGRPAQYRNGGWIRYVMTTGRAGADGTGGKRTGRGDRL